MGRQRSSVESAGDPSMRGADLQQPHQSRYFELVKLLAVVLLIVAAILIGYFAFQALWADDRKQVERLLSANVVRLQETLTMYLSDLADSLEALALSVTLPQAAGVATSFHVLAGKHLRLAHSRIAFVAPFVPSGDEQAWKDLVSAWGAANASPGSANSSVYEAGIVDASVSFSSNGSLAASFLPAAARTASLPGSAQGPADGFFPVIQAHPPSDPAARPLLNLLSLRDVRSLLSRLSANSSAPASTGLTFVLSDARPRAALTAAAPLRQSAAGGAVSADTPVTGLLVFTLMWDDLLSLALPSTPGLEILLSCNPPDPSANADVGPAGALGSGGSGVAFSLRSSSEGVDSVGWGDVLGPPTGRFSDLRRDVSVSFADIRFGLSVRPTEAFYQNSLGGGPADIAIGVGVIFFTFLMLFTASDCVTRRRNHKLSLFFAYKTAQNAADRQAMRARHAFVSMVSHEIRSPASAIVGALDFLRSTELSAVQREFIEMISSGSSQILTLVEDALKVGFDGDGHFSMNPKVINPRTDILENSWNSTRLQKRFADKIKQISMELRIVGLLPHKAIIDSSRACQVINNILGNAIKFTPDGGRVEMQAMCDGNGLLSVSVIDNGRGLSPEGLERLFKPFSQAEGAATKAKYGGTGLGLVISRDICRAMHGDLSVSSDGLGRGCTFTATMQLTDPEWRGNRTASSGGGGGPGSQNGSVDSATGVGVGDPPPSPAAFETPPLMRHIFKSGKRLITEGRRSLSSAANLHAVGRATVPNGPSSYNGGQVSPPQSMQQGAPSPAGWGARGGLAAAGDDTDAYAPPHAPGGRGGASPGSPLGPNQQQQQQQQPPDSSRYSGYAAAPHPFQPKPIKVSSSLLQIKILAAEDDPLVRRVLRMTLKLAGMECEPMADGVAVTDALAADPACADLVLLDANMGGGDLDGLPTLRRIREMFSEGGRHAGLPAPPVVVLSGEQDQHFRDSFLDAGAAQVLLKPASLDTLKSLRSFVITGFGGSPTPLHRQPTGASAGPGGGGSARSVRVSSAAPSVAGGGAGPRVSQISARGSGGAGGASSAEAEGGTRGSTTTASSSPPGTPPPPLGSGSATSIGSAATAAGGGSGLEQGSGGRPEHPLTIIVASSSPTAEGSITAGSPVESAARAFMAGVSAAAKVVRDWQRPTLESLEDEWRRREHDDRRPFARGSMTIDHQHYAQSSSADEGGGGRSRGSQFPTGSPVALRSKSSGVRGSNPMVSRAPRKSLSAIAAPLVDAALELAGYKRNTTTGPASGGTPVAPLHGGGRHPNAPGHTQSAVSGAGAGAGAGGSGSSAAGGGGSFVAPPGVVAAALGGGGSGSNRGAAAKYQHHTAPPDAQHYQPHLGLGPAELAAAGRQLQQPGSARAGYHSAAAGGGSGRTVSFGVSHSAELGSFVAHEPPPLSQGAPQPALSHHSPLSQQHALAHGASMPAQPHAARMSPLSHSQPARPSPLSHSSSAGGAQPSPGPSPSTGGGGGGGGGGRHSAEDCEGASSSTSELSAATAPAALLSSSSISISVGGRDSSATGAAHGRGSVVSQASTAGASSQDGSGSARAAGAAQVHPAPSTPPSTAAAGGGAAAAAAGRSSRVSLSGISAALLQPHTEETAEDMAATPTPSDASVSVPKGSDPLAFLSNTI